MINYNEDSQLYIGLMSGTSMDGIDAALIDFSSNSLIAGITRSYSNEVKNLLNKVITDKRHDLKTFSQLNTLLGREFAKAALELLAESEIPAQAIQAIGSHGQTICHDAYAEIPYTLQLGCAHTIAELTKIKVVADFRTRDLIVGGQGAPFAPLYHQALFKTHPHPLAIINIGGIANISYLQQNEMVSGYDTGPGNCLMDAWIKKHFNKDFDKNGDWASSGNCIDILLENLLNDSYFKREAPKSIGKEYFSLSWLRTFLEPSYQAKDVQATLMMLTATTIIHSIKNLAFAPTQIFICGGGAHNSKLLQTLNQLLPEISIQSTAAINIDPDFIEAIMFAWFAKKNLHNIPLDLGQITGSKRATVLGAIYPAGIDKGI